MREFSRNMTDEPLVMLRRTPRESSRNLRERSRKYKKREGSPPFKPLYLLDLLDDEPFVVILYIFL